MGLDSKTIDGSNGNWVFAFGIEDVELEGVRLWEHLGHSYAIFRSPQSEIFATDDICTHEKAHLSDGFVEGNTVECPRHSGRFSYKTGEALGAPVCVNLGTYETRVVAGKIEVFIRSGA